MDINTMILTLISTALIAGASSHLCIAILSFGGIFVSVGLLAGLFRAQHRPQSQVTHSHRAVAVNPPPPNGAIRVKYRSSLRPLALLSTYYEHLPSERYHGLFQLLPGVIWAFNRYLARHLEYQLERYPEVTPQPEGHSQTSSGH